MFLCIACNSWGASALVSFMSPCSCSCRLLKAVRLLIVLFLLSAKVGFKPKFLAIATMSVFLFFMLCTLYVSGSNELF